MLGPDEATTLMEHMPPVGWADVATKRDLEHFAAVIRAELHGEISGLRGEFRGEIGGLRAEMQRDMRLQAFSLIAAVAALNGAMLAILRL